MTVDFWLIRLKIKSVFENYYDFHQYILSRFNPLLSADIKKLLEQALNDYNDRKQKRFIDDLRKIAAYLEEIGKINEARATRNQIILWQWQANIE